jgi:hypothetical protein
MILRASFCIEMPSFAARTGRRSRAQGPEPPACFSNRSTRSFRFAISSSRRST